MSECRLFTDVCLARTKQLVWPMPLILFQYTHGWEDRMIKQLFQSLQTLYIRTVYFPSSVTPHSILGPKVVSFEMTCEANFKVH
jgi:hypothetical protein